MLLIIAQLLVIDVSVSSSCVVD